MHVKFCFEYAKNKEVGDTAKFHENQYTVNNTEVSNNSSGNSIIDSDSVLPVG